MWFKKWLPTLTFLGFSVLTLVFLAWSQKPLCIESRVVERLDRFGAQGTEAVYRCSSRVRVPYTQFWGDNVRSVSDRLVATERFLENIEPFSKKYQISIFQDRPLLYRIQGTQVFLGETLIKTPGQLERLLVSLWVYEKANRSPEQPGLLEEALVDLLLEMAWDGNKLVNPLTGARFNLIGVSWPQAIQSEENYCESFWALPQHYQFCAQRSSTQSKAKIEHRFVEMSLRSLVYRNLRQSFEQLTWGEQYRLLLSTAKMLRSQPVLEKSKEFFDDSLSDIEHAAQLMASVGDLLFSAGVDLSDDRVKAFSTYYRAQLEGDQALQSSSVAKVDYLLRLQRSSFEESIEFKNLVDWSQKNPEIKVGIQNGDDLYLLPNTHALSANSFGSIRSRNLMIESCGDFEISYLLSLEAVAERVLLLNSCNRKAEIDLTSYVDKGVEKFAAKNSRVAFVYLHIPSLQSRKMQIEKLGQIFANIRHPQTPLAKALGWQEIRFNSQTKAYEPHAAIEGIQLYRLSKEN